MVFEGTRRDCASRDSTGGKSGGRKEGKDEIEWKKMMRRKRGSVKTKG